MPGSRTILLLCIILSFPIASIAQNAGWLAGKPITAADTAAFVENNVRSFSYQLLGINDTLGYSPAEPCAEAWVKQENGSISVQFTHYWSNWELNYNLCFWDSNTENIVIPKNIKHFTKVVKGPWCLAYPIKQTHYIDKQGKLIRTSCKLIQNREERSHRFEQAYLCERIEYKYNASGLLQEIWYIVPDKLVGFKNRPFAKVIFRYGY
jgi:hypothetical protein